MPSTEQACRWCCGTGWATLIDHYFGDAYEIPCPGGCLPPQPSSDAA